MPSGLRAQIAMDDVELAGFLDEQCKIVLATLGPRGVPHLVMLGYTMRRERPWAWSFARAQKVLNLTRDPRATLFAEAGESYEEYRGASLECDVVIHREIEVVRAFGRELLSRYGGRESIADAIDVQAAKRVALEFVPVRTITYDHRKLPAGTY